MKSLPLQERVRQRFRARVADGNVSHEVIGKYLGLTRSAVTRLLNDEGAGFALHHIERLCEFFQITACEVVAEDHARMVAVTPMEAQLLSIYRNMTAIEQNGLLTVLDRSARALPARRRRSKLGHAPLTDEQQLVVDLFARSDPQAREGVLKILRGTAKIAAAHSRDTSE